MKYFSVKILIIVVFYIMRPLSASALEIGKSWEFNENGNTEGWAIHRDLADLTVSDGLLKASSTGLNATFSGPECDVAAFDFGFITLRMKAAGATSGKVEWETDNSESDYVEFQVINDSLFHEYEIPVCSSPKWKGQIKRIKKLIIGCWNTKLEIDYIRIVSVGPRFEIEFFKPLRTVLKQGDSIPLIASIKNVGDRSSSVTAKLVLPEQWQIISGETENHLNEWNVGAVDTDTLRWTIQSQIVGDYQFKLELSCADTVHWESSLEMPLENQYWQLDDLTLSAWGYPDQTEEDMSRYVSAHFNKIICLKPDVSQVESMANLGFECMIDLSSTLGGGSYLRGFDDQPAYELTDDMLTKVDPIIEQFRNHPAVFGYHICDEPNATAFENLAKVVAYLRKKDPTRLAFINLYPCYGSPKHFGKYSYKQYIERFMDIVRPELLSYDHYHFKIGVDEPLLYFHNLEIVREFACRYDIPFCNVIQGQGVPQWGWRTPSLGEFRYLNYSTLAYGGKWIVYWCWYLMKQDPSFDTVIYPSVQELNQEILALNPVLVDLHSEAVYHTGEIPSGCSALPSNTLVKSVSNNAEFVVGFFKDNDNNNNDYIMFMNKDYGDSVTAAITLNSSVADLKVFDINTGEWQNVVYQNTTKGTVFECTLRPGGGKLFSIGISTSIDDVSNIFTPNNYTLYQNYPNPFNPITSIVYTIAKSEHVILKIYDLLGREVKTIVDSEQQSGTHTVELDASDLSSGVYLYSLETCTFKKCRKMLLLK